MLLLHGPRGSVDWGNTSTFFRNNISSFVALNRTGVIPYPPQDDWVDFGAGKEPTFLCRCNRRLPLIVGDSDHIQPKSGLVARVDANVMAITRIGEIYTFPTEGVMATIQTDGGEIVLRRFKVQPGVQGPEMRISSNPVPSLLTPYQGTYFNPVKLQNVVTNDIDNLRMLCRYCNTSRGNRETH